MQAGEQQDKSIATLAADGVAAVNTLLQAFGDGTQQFVADMVAERVVDVLKRSRSMNATASFARCACSAEWPAVVDP